MNKNIKLFLYIISLGFLMTVGNSWNRSAISIYNRYPILVLCLIAILVYALLGNKFKHFVLEWISYLVLYLLLLYRIIFEMEGFITFNASYGWLEYIKVVFSLVIFGIITFFSVKDYVSKRM